MLYNDYTESQMYKWEMSRSLLCNIYDICNDNADIGCQGVNTVNYVIFQKLNRVIKKAVEACYEMDTLAVQDNES